MVERSVEVLDPSEEFPILYALLTAAGLQSAKHKPLHPSSFSASAPKDTSGGQAAPVEPDSSTADIEQPAAFPLLLLTLTRPAQHLMARRLPRTNTTLPTYGYGNTIKSPLDSEEESEETPSSTTEDDLSSDAESPRKRSRMSKTFGERESSEELEMPHLEPMVSTTCSSPPSVLQESLMSSTSGDRSPSMSPPTLLPVKDIPIPSFTPNREENSKESREKLPRRSHQTTNSRHHKILPSNTAKISSGTQRQLRKPLSSSSEEKAVSDLKAEGPVYRRKVPGGGQGTFVFNVPAPSLPTSLTSKSLADLDMDSDSELTQEELNFDKKDYLLLPLDIDLLEDSDSPTYPNPILPTSADKHLYSNQARKSRERRPPLKVKDPSLKVKERQDVRQDSSQVQVFPCGHCNQVFDTITRLVRHASSAHLSRSDNLAMDIEIETDW